LTPLSNPPPSSFLRRCHVSQYQIVFPCSPFISVIQNSGLILQLIWPTPSGSNPSGTNQYQALACAVQAAVNQSVLQATLQSIQTFMGNAQSNVLDMLRYQYASFCIQSFLIQFCRNLSEFGNAESSAFGALNDLETAWTYITTYSAQTGNSPFGTTSLLPYAISVA
jgi:hypothetical protein